MYLCFIFNLIFFCLVQLTQEEILKLHSTINELESNLERTRELQEEEEKNKKGAILKLNKEIEKLKQDLKNAEDRAKVCC